MSDAEAITPEMVEAAAEVLYNRVLCLSAWVVVTLDENDPHD